MQTVSVQALSKSYGSTARCDDVSFEVDQGEVFALLGPNGAGKTSTLEILEGFRERDSGEVRVLGLDPGERRTGAAAAQPDRRGAPGARGRAVSVGASGARAQRRLLRISTPRRAR